MYQCPRCHYETSKKNDLKCHFYRKKPCLPIHDDISLQKLQEKVVVRNAFKIIENNTFNNTHSPLNTNSITSFDNISLQQNNKKENNKLECKYCHKIYSTSSNLCKHVRRCKVKKEQDLEKKDIKNIEIKNLKEQLEILREEILDLKIKNKETILRQSR